MNELVTVRRASPSDCAGVWPLVCKFATSFVPERQSFETSFASVIAEISALALVAVDTDGQIVGYLLAASHQTFFANGPVVWIEELMVAEHARRGGLGSKLTAEAEAWGQSIGAAYISLATRRAPEFYRALGYEPSATFFRKVSQ